MGGLWMQDSGELYKSILDNLYDGVYFVDRRRRITYWNRGAERISGFAADQVVGRTCADGVLVHVDDQGTLLCQTMCPLAKTIADGATREAQVYLRHAHGHRIPVLIRAVPIRDAGGEIIGAVEVFRDNSAYTAAVSRLSELDREVFLDALTSVGNRRYMEIKIQRSLAECAHHGVSSGVLFVDIDRFKRINDTHGHDAGDAVLGVVANTLRHSIRSTDYLGRWGGDEFVAVVLNVDSAGLATVAGKLRALVHASRVPVGRDHLNVTVSVGGTLTRPDDTLETLLRRADQSLYRSKEAGRDAVSVTP
jgi:diguanylate cyclase (GGDEF)-like protein/PAS domain S-box-containing protein